MWQCGHITRTVPSLKVDTAASWARRNEGRDHSGGDRDAVEALATTEDEISLVGSSAGMLRLTARLLITSTPEERVASVRSLGPEAVRRVVELAERGVQINAA
jgi:hypothetical protein